MGGGGYQSEVHVLQPVRQGPNSERSLLPLPGVWVPRLELEWH